jgi:hypothetical protein
MPGINTNTRVLYGVVAVVLRLKVAFSWLKGGFAPIPVCRPRIPTVEVFLPHHFDRHFLRKVNTIEVLDTPTEPKHVILIKYRYLSTLEGLHDVYALSYLR